MTSLPVAAVLPELCAMLREGSAAVLVAPPGAGKTTGVPPILLGEPWCSGQILLLSPRRIAARAAAERMASLAGEAVGKTYGYATRLDTRASAATRVLVMTEGIFRQRIIADPGLEGISAVLFDEVHERSLDSDFGLALAIESQTALRPDLKLLAMSATLDGARFAALLGDAPQIVSDGRSHPLTVHHIGRDPGQRLETAMAAAIRRALVDSQEGDVLAFLPGVRDIDRTAELLVGIAAVVLPLHGQLEPAEQQAALSRDRDGRRKVILATSIAETSLTIDGVRIVVDSGMTRRARYDVAGGATRLVTERTSQASATQRAGRAARQGPGVAYRLWEAAATGAMARFDPPEIIDADLAPLLLDCALWGERDPARLPWLDAPPAAALADARSRLQRIGAIDADSALTDHGRAMAALPLPPALAHMLVEAAPLGLHKLAADVAMLLSEQALGGRDVDLAARHHHWQRERGQRAEAARRTAARWATLVKADAAGTNDLDHDQAIAFLVATAFPDRVARSRGGDGSEWQSVGGRGYRLDSGSSLASSGWLAIAAAQGAAGGARIMSAVAMDSVVMERWTALHGEERRMARYDRINDRAEAMVERRIGSIILSRAPDPDIRDRTVLLIDAVRSEGLMLLDWGTAASRLRQRARFAGIDVLDEAALSERLDDWLAPLLAGKRGLRAIADDALADALLLLLDWPTRQRLDTMATPRFTTPAGSTHAIDYAAHAGPTVELRVQTLYGLDQHPSVGQPAVPLILSLTSPAGRPIQTTRDLPGFWRGSWADVAKEMRGRYPKHPWPDAPWLASATLRTKRADAARG